MNADIMIAAFFPFSGFAASVLPELGGDAAGDGAHDMAHLMRVWRNARTIAAAEGGAGMVLASRLPPAVSWQRRGCWCCRTF